MVSLPELGLRAKLLAMAASTILAVGAIGGAYFFFQAQIDRATAVATTADGSLARISTARLAAGSLLAATQSFYMTPTEEAAAMIKSQVEQLKTIGAGLADEPSVQAAIATMPAVAVAVVDNVTTLGFTPDLGLQGTLRKAVHGVEDVLNEEIKAGASLDGLLVQMLTLRRNEKDFMLRKDAKYVTSFDDAVTKFASALTASSLDAGKQTTISGLTTTYAAEFHNYATGLNAALAALADFEKSYPAASAVIDERLVAAQNARDAADVALAGYRSTMSLTLLITFAVALAGSLTLAFFVARSIAGPLTGMTRVMRELADGKFDLEVPFVGRRDELGKMATAVQVFKENGEKVAAMSLDEAERVKLITERAQMMHRFQTAFDAVVAATVEGDFSKTIDAHFGDADIDRISKNFNGMLATVRSSLAETARVLAAMAQADLTKRMEGNFKGAFADLRTDMDAVGNKLTELIGQLRHTSGSLKTATGEILAGTNDLADRTSKQAAAIEETSAAMEQLAGTVTANAKRAEDASARAQSVSKTAEETGAVMQKSTEAMERISTSSSKISNIIGLIDDIAFQTNLLALNASVEAARAGDAGKGFAVVAVEVRRLAQSAASASAEVKVLIEQSASEVSGGSRLVAEAAQKLTSMLSGVRESASLIQSIAAANQQQSGAISEVTTAIREMDQMTQHNAALVEETNAAIEQTEQQANDLDRIVEVFAVDDGQAARQAKNGKSQPRPAARSGQSVGNAALKDEWSEF